MVRSSDPVATHRPSALTAIVFNFRVCPTGLAVSPLDSSQTLTVLSTLAERMVRPFGPNATELTQSRCPRRARNSVLVDKSQTRTTVSPPPDTRNRPSPLNATELTGFTCPLNSASRTGAPVPTVFQCLTNPSPPHVASLVPSGPYTAEPTPDRWAVNAATSLGFGSDRSNTRSIPSADPIRACLPSARRATALIIDLFVANGCGGASFDRSHSRAILSMPPVISVVFPPNATAMMGAV